MIACLTFLLGVSLPGPSQPLPPDIAPPECLVLARVEQGGRSPVHTDAIERAIVLGTWARPKAGDAVSLADGTMQTWKRVAPGKDGVLQDEALRGGYAFVPVDVGKAQVRILEASGHSLVYVNGEPRTGDIYGAGWTRLPIRLRAGRNDLLFRCGRGDTLHVKLIAPKAPALLNTRDTTLPDLITGTDERQWGAVVVLNATNAPLTGLTLRVHRAGVPDTVTPLPPLPPLTTRKVGFTLAGRAPSTPGNVTATLTLARQADRRAETLDTAQIELRVRRPDETYRRTFLSAIDGSVQYYAVNPARPLRTDAPPPALILSLHGAGVEAIGQADAYEGKTWATLVAPTNRRPFGFDWEDWGCLDALEVLDIAQKRLRTDPRRIYLTGHSMGGHGTWHLGVTFPDRFAAIGPSAGWISFASYAGASPRSENPTPMQKMLTRPTLPSDTLALKSNLAQDGVYILHGGADDNVPVEQARTMARELGAFHRDWVYHEQPGAGHWWDASDEPGTDCVDWQPMNDFFARHALPDDESVRQVDFVTADPGVSARCHWATIETQLHALKLSAVHLRCDPGPRRFVGTTENVARLALSLTHLSPTGTLTLELDGQKLAAVPYPTQTQRLTLARTNGVWAVVPAPSPALKGPERCGPFKQAFRNRMLFVYGTQGTPEENAWAFAKARYDAETFWYRGNGAVDIIADKTFDAAKERDRNIILYGNAETNAAWNALLSACPVSVQRNRVRVGAQEWTGGDLACLFVYPRPGSDRASVGVVSGTGLVGMRLTDRQPYLAPGVGYPDCLVFSAEMLTKGIEGVRAAGFFGPDWSVTGGEFVFDRNRLSAR